MQQGNLIKRHYLLSSWRQLFPRNRSNKNVAIVPTRWTFKVLDFSVTATRRFREERIANERATERNSVTGWLMLHAVIVYSRIDSQSGRKRKAKWTRKRRKGKSEGFYLIRLSEKSVGEMFARARLCIRRGALQATISNRSMDSNRKSYRNSDIHIWNGLKAFVKA